MFALSLLVLRYCLGTASIAVGLVFLPTPLPLGVPLILAGIALYAGSTKPIVAGWQKVLSMVRRRTPDKPPYSAPAE